MPLVEELAVVSRFAAALARLPDDALDDFNRRFGVYPVREIAVLAPQEFRCADAAALRAERARRELRVGAGFSSLCFAPPQGDRTQPREAA